MKVQLRVNFRVSIVLKLLPVLLSLFPEYALSATVTLEAIEIYTTHEVIAPKPTIYFMCKGEKKIILPDVKEAHRLYAFKGEESWQPLTELPDTKCKRCGFYEKDIIKSDDVFDEWELCASDFSDPHGTNIRLKKNEFNATFLCPHCVPLGQKASNHESGEHKGGKGARLAAVIAVAALISTVIVVGMVSAYKYWQKRKREQEQARFLKLFEDDDDIEDELGIGPLSNTI